MSSNSADTLSCSGMEGGGCKTAEPRHTLPDWQQSNRNQTIMQRHSQETNILYLWDRWANSTCQFSMALFRKKQSDWFPKSHHWQKKNSQFHLCFEKWPEGTLTPVSSSTSDLCVFSLVSSEVTRRGKTLSTRHAVIRRHPRVSLLVYIEIFWPRETLPTLWAVIRLLSSVCALVYTEICHRRKTLSTLCAMIRLLSCVYALMHAEIFWPRETFPALGAVVRLLSSVYALVFAEIF